MQTLSDRSSASDAWYLRHRSLINWGALVLACVWLVAIIVSLDPHVDDFKQYWQAAVNIRSTGDAYFTTPGPGAPAQNPRIAAYPYPPLLAYLLLPLSKLTYTDARLLWLAFNVALLVLIVWLAIHLSGSQLARQWWGVVGLISIIAPPTRLSLQLGQVSLLLTALLLGAFALLTPAHQKVAWWRIALIGFLLALATIIKLYPALLIVYFLLRGPRSLVWASALAGAGLFLGSLLAYGPVPYQTYMQRVLLGGYYPYEAEFNVSLMGLWERLLTTNRFAIALVDQPRLAQICTAISTLLFVLLLFSTLRYRSDRLTERLQEALWLCAMLLLSPVNGYYNLLALVYPFLVMLAFLEQHRQQWLRLWLIGAGLLCAIPSAWAVSFPDLHNWLHIGWGILFLQPALYGLMLLMGLLVVSIAFHNDTGKLDTRAVLETKST